MSHVQSAVLLCGGGSRRLGFPKEMLRVDGAPLAVHMVRRLRDAFDQVAVSSNKPDYLRLWLDTPIIEDAPGEEGPLAGVAAGLRNCAGGKGFFVGCDMPLAHIGLIHLLLERADRSDAPAIIARAGGHDQPLFAVYSRSLLPGIEGRLAAGDDRSIRGLLNTVAVERVDFTGADAACLRDVDTPADMRLLREAFDEVEPLPVEFADVTRVGRPGPDRDTVALERPVTVLANGVRLATIMCMPNAIRELALGFAVYLGLTGQDERAEVVEVDYRAMRVSLRLEADDERIRNATRFLVTSTCGANLYGPERVDAPALPGDADFRVRPSHIFESLRSLREMSPVFDRTGCTHQAAFSDGDRVRFFFEDIGRHNAADKVVGAALLQNAPLDRGVMLTTGRLNTEMVVKAVRARVPALASRSAATSAAIRLARERGLTLVGFARGGRLNVYTAPERIIDE